MCLSVNLCTKLRHYDLSPYFAIYHRLAYFIYYCFYSFFCLLHVFSMTMMMSTGGFVDIYFQALFVSNLNPYKR